MAILSSMEYEFLEPKILREFQPLEIFLNGLLIYKCKWTCNTLNYCCNKE